MLGCDMAGAPDREEVRLKGLEAARKAVVEYQEMAADLTIEQGLAKQSFVRPTHTQQRGDVEAGLDAAARVLEGDFHIGGLD